MVQRLPQLQHPHQQWPKQIAIKKRAMEHIDQHKMIIRPIHRQIFQFQAQAPESLAMVNLIKLLID